MLLLNDIVTAEAAVAWIAASRLCLKMADEFQKEDECGEAFDSCVVDLLREMEKQHILRPKSATHHGRIDQCMLVLCSEAHWHSATSLRWCWRSPKALLVLMEVMEWLLRAGIREEFCSAVGATDKVHGVLWSLESLENPK